jgi:uncharacterized membrane protein YadS
MSPSTLTPVVYSVAVLSWICAIALVRLARHQPRYRVLVERANVSVLLAIFVTAYALGVINVDSGFAFFPDQASRVVLRFSTILLGLIPAIWLVNYWRRTL